MKILRKVYKSKILIKSMVDKDSGKVIKRPYLFATFIAVPIAIANLLNIYIFNYGIISFILLTLAGFYLGKLFYFRYFNVEKKV